MTAPTSVRRYIFWRTSPLRSPLHRSDAGHQRERSEQVGTDNISRELGQSKLNDQHAARDRHRFLNTDSSEEVGYPTISLIEDPRVISKSEKEGEEHENRMAELGDERNGGKRRWLVRVRNSRAVSTWMAG